MRPDIISKSVPRIRIIIASSMVIIILLMLTFLHEVSVGYNLAVNSELPLDKMDLFAKEFSSSLPILVMRTDVSMLYDRDMPPSAVIWIFDKGEGENRLTDAPAQVLDYTTANYRGYFSITFPQKPYKLSLYRNAFSDIVPLSYAFFGLDPASEWVLRPTYADKSLLRDWFSYEVAASVLYWQPRGTMVNVFLQDGEIDIIEYQGVYFITQYIPAADNMIIALGDFSLRGTGGVDFTGGGYLFQRDRMLDFANNVRLPDRATYRIMYPGRRGMSSAEDARVKDEIIFFHNFMNRRGAFENIPDDEWDYWNYIDLDSFVNYFLVAEMIKNLDVGLASTYIYRPEGGKFVMGPLWDSDLSMGNNRLAEDSGYFYVFRRDIISSLLEDMHFQTKVVETWQQYRNSIWSNEELLKLYDAMANDLIEPASLNAERWPEMYNDATNLGRDSLSVFTASWEEEIEVTRQWLIERIQWLDEYIPKLLHEHPAELNHHYRSLQTAQMTE